MRNYFPKRTSGAPLHTLSKLYDVPVGFVSPSFETMYCYICGRRRVVVALYRMICLVLISLAPYRCFVNRPSTCGPISSRGGTIVKPTFPMGQQKLDEGEIDELVQRLYKVPSSKEKIHKHQLGKQMDGEEINEMVNASDY